MSITIGRYKYDLVKLPQEIGKQCFLILKRKLRKGYVKFLGVDYVLFFFLSVSERQRKAV